MLNPSVESTPSSLNPARLPSLPPPNASPIIRKRTEPSSPTRDAGMGVPPVRRILTPKSPALRAVSLGATVLPSIHAVTAAAPQTLPPRSDSRIYTAEPGVADVPALPQISAPPRSLPPIQSRDDLRGPHGQPPPAEASTSQAASTHFRHDPETRTPWTAQNAPQYDRSPPSRYGTFAPQAASNQPLNPAFRNEVLQRAGPEAYRTDQPSYQIAFDTEEGHVVVPVTLDLKQASKVADEKRKRNAGASARFRARRKEKEKEASHTISSLKQEMDELRAHRDFYRQERDFIRDFAAAHVAARLPERPPSPIAYYTSAQAESPRDTSEPRSDSGPAPQRRRTDEYYPSSYPPALPPQARSAEFGPTHTSQVALLCLTLRLISLQVLTVLACPGRLDLLDQHHSVGRVFSRHSIHFGASLWKEPGNKVAEETADSVLANPLVALVKTARTSRLLPHIPIRNCA
ncbi:uncharacterized protein AB675_744 [Cyphellophora attinorum]|uniref:BZIP domain-containing protein n=1 Tax=Cyphellophora attinorum TaxID=1664694 RepID=A0A0N1HI76_9EURO|nr:uncharacterized protein AB675_744 [Phialophora attinorum]KPI45937.1 hypothetical protein AB675_744 [Phialophora attinorum]